MRPDVQCRAYLSDDLHLAVEPSGTALDQRHVGGQTHLVHMPPRLQIVQRVEHESKRLEPRHIELVILDVRVIRLNARIRVEPARRFLCDLTG
jgi:hypothetical protein